MKWYLIGTMLLKAVTCLLVYVYTRIDYVMCFTYVLIIATLITSLLVSGFGKDYDPFEKL